MVRLGSGAFAEVKKAAEIDTGRIVAIKVGSIDLTSLCSVGCGTEPRRRLVAVHHQAQVCTEPKDASIVREGDLDLAESTACELDHGRRRV
jgi:serine/threonine protein kinase